MLFRSYFEEEARVSEHFSEMASELSSLGIFRQRDVFGGIAGNNLGYSLTKFGHSFIKYVAQSN